MVRSDGLDGESGTEAQPTSPNAEAATLRSLRPDAEPMRPFPVMAGRCMVCDPRADVDDLVGHLLAAHPAEAAGALVIVPPAGQAPS